MLAGTDELSSFGVKAGVDLIARQPALLAGGCPIAEPQEARNIIVEIARFSCSLGNAALGRPVIAAPIASGQII